jgi:hypothetical protein
MELSKETLKKGLMGLAISSSLTIGLLKEPKLPKHEPSENETTTISVEGDWAAGLAIYGTYASDSSATAAASVMGGFAAIAAVFPGGQFAAGYYGL